MEKERTIHLKARVPFSFSSEMDKVYNTAGTSFSTNKVSWDYDENGRLKSEFRDEGNDSTVGVPDDAGDYFDEFEFDLAGNRITKTHHEVGSTNYELITYAYSDIDQLMSEDSNIPANDVDNTYDENGSLLTAEKNGHTSRYVWDVRNRMVGIDADNNLNTSSTGDTNYGYDGNGVRVSESTVGGTTTYYLNDPNNPTGYADLPPISVPPAIRV